MKTLFAALASALLVSTAFAQTVAPNTAQSAQMPPAGQANLKASPAAQTDATDKGATAAATKAHMKKTSAAHTATTHKAPKKAAVKTSAAKSKTESAKEASNAPAKADGAQTDTTKTQ
jgi:hypothetical protein